MIQIQNLQFGYGREPLYQGFDLKLSSTGLHGLFGRNGSGKSTLLKLMAGLIFPRAGSVRVAGFEPRRRAPEFLSQVYIVPEEFHLPNLSCRQLAQHQAGFYPRFDQGLYDEALETFELDADTRFERMSLGGKKKAVIAFALATRTPLLLLDEPTNGMDIVARDRFRDLVRQPVHADRTILISTHQAHDLERLIAHVLFIESGHLALSVPMTTLATSLRMGICENEALPPGQEVLYREAIGNQTAFISARQSAEADEPVQLELLYRALCREPGRILQAVQHTEAGHV